MGSAAVLCLILSVTSRSAMATPTSGVTMRIGMQTTCRFVNIVRGDNDVIAMAEARKAIWSRLMAIEPRIAGNSDIERDEILSSVIRTCEDPVHFRSLEMATQGVYRNLVANQASVDANKRAWMTMINGQRRAEERVLMARHLRAMADAQRGE